MQLVFQSIFLSTFKVNIGKWHFYSKPRLEKIPHFNQPGSLFEGGVVEYEYSSERYFIFECQHYKGQKCMKHKIDLDVLLLKQNWTLPSAIFLGISSMQGHFCSKDSLNRIAKILYRISIALIKCFHPFTLSIYPH